MRKAFVSMQRLQPWHDDFYHSPVQPLPRQHWRRQVSDQNGMLLESLTQDREAFIQGCGFFGRRTGAIEHGSVQFVAMKAIIDGMVGESFQRSPQDPGATLLSQVADVVAALYCLQGGFDPARATRRAAS